MAEEEKKYIYGVNTLRFDLDIQKDKITIDKVLVIKETDKQFQIARDSSWYGFGVRISKDDALHTPEEAIEAWKMKLLKDAEKLEEKANKLHSWRNSVSMDKIVIEEKNGR